MYDYKQPNIGSLYNTERIPACINLLLHVELSTLVFSTYRLTKWVPITEPSHLDEFKAFAIRIFP